MDSSSFISSTIADNVTASTPNRKDSKKPSNIRVSPILGQNAIFRQSEFSDSNFFSSQHSIASSYRGDYTSRPMTNCLEIAKIRNFGYVNIQSTRNLAIVIRNRYSQMIMLDVKLSGSDSEVFRITNDEDELRSVHSGRETMVNVCFMPTKRTMYTRSLIVTVIPDRRSGLPRKKYEVILIGHGGTAILRISQDKNELSPAKFKSKPTLRSTGQFDARMQSNRTASFLLQNSGDRSAFIYVRALDQYGEDISLKRLSVAPSQLLVNKLCSETKHINVKVLDERLWQRLVHKNEEIRLAIYSVVERQRMRLMEYARIRRQQIEPIEEIDFTSFGFTSDERITFDATTISSEDVRVFKEELRINFIRLLPPKVLTEINELHELDDKKFALLPVQFEYDVVKEFDDDEVTTVGMHPSRKY